MERRAPEYHLDVCADRSSVRHVVKGILHTIFFHRYFTPLYPSTHEILDTTLPYVSEDDIDSLIDTRTSQLIRALDTRPSHLQINFLERKRRKSGWFVTKADEETVWESWFVNVEILTSRSDAETQRNRRVMERQLQKAAMKVVGICNRERAHIPPITTNDSNPFPYQVIVNANTGK